MQAPLARPNETRTLAYIVVRPNREPPALFVPGQDPDSRMPAEVRRYQSEIEPKIKTPGDEYSFLNPADEQAMRASVAMVALSQRNHPSPMWEPQQRDCAGLVRFAYRQSLAPRSDRQLKNLGAPQQLFFPTVSNAARRVLPYYPELWLVGKDRYDSFADAETLAALNFRPVSRNADDARRGDLLVFENPTVAVSPFHLMLVAEDRSSVVVYHNGNEGKSGAVRVVDRAELERGDDPDWIPRQDNQRFLGVFQWNKFNPSAISEAGGKTYPPSLDARTASAFGGCFPLRQGYGGQDGGYSRQYSSSLRDGILNVCYIKGGAA